MKGARDHTNLRTVISEFRPMRPQIIMAGVADHIVLGKDFSWSRYCLFGRKLKQMIINKTTNNSHDVAERKETAKDRISA